METKINGVEALNVASALGELTFLCRLLLRIHQTFAGLAGGNRRCLLTRPLVAATPDGVHTVACRRVGDASAWLTPDTSYDKDKVQPSSWDAPLLCLFMLPRFDR